VKAAVHLRTFLVHENIDLPHHHIITGNSGGSQVGRDHHRDHEEVHERRPLEVEQVVKSGVPIASLSIHTVTDILPRRTIGALVILARHRLSARSSTVAEVAKAQTTEPHPSANAALVGRKELVQV